MLQHSIEGTTSLTNTLAISCGVLQRILLQDTATDCTIIQRVATLSKAHHTNAPTISCGVLQRMMLQYTATDCNVLQHVATFYRGHHSNALVMFVYMYVSTF